MLLRYVEFKDKPKFLTLQNESSEAMADNRIPAYVMATLGNMSYIASTNFCYNVREKAHILIGNYCQIAHDTVF